jgi:hypothetical protein
LNTADRSAVPIALAAGEESPDNIGQCTPEKEVSVKVHEQRRKKLPVESQV